ncbi:MULTISPECIES: SiaB family protein kinase [unclassified Acidovorax]|uniref:SiaB family protein kinase n=1 Tax=unclassified Acidovorax TaxID=2684926 RepID=UPI002882EDB0|nr:MULTISPECIES: SiaB family protein kinase [unclassified Acidovorax]
MPSPLMADKYGSFFQLARQHQVIFYYVGYFSQHIVAAMADAVKLQLEVAGVPAPTRRKLFSSFVEMAQNIIHYSADSLTPASQTDGELRHGSVCIRRESDGRFLLLCSNPVEPPMAEELRVKLSALRSMTLDEIKQAYRQSLREETPQGSKGAGLGFLTVARDASEPLEFDFDFTADDLPGHAPVFYLKAAI